MVCEAVSVPTVETVEWFYSGGLPVMTGNGGKFSVLENRSNDGVRSVLVIAGVRREDLGQYTCQVTNSLGTDSAVFTLQQNGKKSFQFLLLLRNLTRKPLLPQNQSNGFKFKSRPRYCFW